MADSELSKDQERLAKLWDAYEIQERELELSLKKIATLEHKIEELNRVNNVMKKAMENRDKEIRDLELKLVSLEEQNSKYEPQINELNKLYLDEKERYTKLFTITEELEEELERAKRESEIKDKWFERNVGMLENLRESIVERNIELKDVEGGGPPNTKSESESIPKPVESIPPPVPAQLAPEAEAGSEPASEPVKGEEAVTFKKVTLEKEAAPEPTAPEMEITTEASKNETIYEFTKIPDVDPLIAESLYDSGYTRMEKLKAATTEDLAKIDGVSPTLARKIRTNLFEMK
ncbi:helix-hairpin-helix domain-containing protein [[Eubacterium] cellulosolvens]